MFVVLLAVIGYNGLVWATISTCADEAETSFSYMMHRLATETMLGSALITLSVFLPFAIRSKYLTDKEDQEIMDHAASVIGLYEKHYRRFR